MLALVVLGCGAGGASNGGQDTGLDGLSLVSVNPSSLVPGSLLIVGGDSFVDALYGATSLHLIGTFAGAATDVQIPMTFVDYQHLQVSWPGGRQMGLSADSGVFDGDATVEVLSTIDDAVHASPAMHLKLAVATTLTPRLDSVEEGVVFVNQPMTVEGDGFLLAGGNEGQTVASVAGCFTESGSSTCTPITTVEVPVTADTVSDRTKASFPFHPRIAGINPGRFQGTVKLINHLGSGAVTTASAPQTIDCTLVPPTIFGVSPTSASLGQYVDIRGGGFIGPDTTDPTAVTTLQLSGTFLPEGSSTAVPVNLTLIPQFVAGPLVRYVVSEDDQLGHSVDLRHSAGKFAGTMRPVTSYGADTVQGDPAPVTLSLAHIKQVVWLRFQPAFVESLRHFGLRALDADIRARVFAVAARDYTGVNIEFRPDVPDDFALYSIVDISGPDINNLGLFGYDNSPGKDVDNQRLYDQIGGLNATTQSDGDPGYGGVFVESFFSFSMHPNGLALAVDGADAIFDEIFDPFRPDVSGGSAVLAADLADGIDTLDDGSGCPAAKGDRSAQISCAVWVLGSMIGTTMTHEVGHSLGLAAPHGDPDQYHDLGDRPNRLMDAGGARTLRERAELDGEGPAVFCDDEYTYLRATLPSIVPAPDVDRPPCD